jgi:hypothetical protein
MKKIIVGLATVVALSSTAAMADTPAVKELNNYDHIVAVGTKNREATNRASEFVIYHQDARRPCGHKGKHEAAKKEEHKHHHHHHHMKDDGKKAAKKPAVNEQNQNTAPAAQ